MRKIVYLFSVFFFFCGTCFALDYSGVGNLSLDTTIKQKTIIEQVPLTLNRNGGRTGNGAEYIDVDKPPCPSGLTPQIIITIDSVVPLAKLNSSTSDIKIDPVAATYLKILDKGDYWRIYVAMKTLSDHLVGCSPDCTSASLCKYCDSCPSIGVNSDADSSAGYCSDYTIVNLTATIICK